MREKSNLPTVIVGGCGFIGSNLAENLLRSGERVTIIDNLSRPGVSQNLDWLKELHGDQLSVNVSDIRDPQAIDAIIAEAGAIYHLAAQTAVTTSLVDPIEDFEINARGTLNILEAVRKTARKIPVVFASTNKDYGALGDISIRNVDGRDLPADEALRAHGISEDRPLDFSTPYGRSKGVADQYVLDYAGSYGIPTAVLRMSCIYGPRQFGTEDQGRVAHFLIRALQGKPITIYGDGQQVRDVLHVSDAVAAYRAVLASIDKVSGQAFNLGGGPRNAVSLNAVLEEIGRVTGTEIDITHDEWREGDQRYFVADTSKLTAELGWK